MCKLLESVLEWPGNETSRIRPWWQSLLGGENNRQREFLPLCVRSRTRNVFNRPTARELKFNQSLARFLWACFPTMQIVTNNGFLVLFLKTNDHTIVISSVCSRENPTPMCQLELDLLGYLEECQTTSDGPGYVVELYATDEGGDCESLDSSGQASMKIGLDSIIRGWESKTRHNRTGLASLLASILLHKSVKIQTLVDIVSQAVHSEVVRQHKTAWRNRWSGCLFQTYALSWSIENWHWTKIHPCCR